MNFVLHFTIRSFVEKLQAGSIVYLATYTLGVGKEETKHLLLTTDGGIEGGTIQAVNMRILEKAEADSTKVSSLEASEMFIAFLKTRRVTVLKGVLATAGLNDTLQYWNEMISYSLAEISGVLNAFKRKS